MADRLFPAFDVPDIGEDEEYDSEYKKSVKWNPESGDFVRDGSNNMVECDGMEAYMIWCYKMVQTERYSHNVISGGDCRYRIRCRNARWLVARNSDEP